jgi:hypothetical protein
MNGVSRYGQPSLLRRKRPMPGGDGAVVLTDLTLSHAGGGARPLGDRLRGASRRG